MGTRGFIGFVAEGETKIAYNHFDSYPDHLGRNMLGWLRSLEPQELEERARLAGALRAVAPGSEPTDEDIAALQKFYNPNVGGRSERPTWYQLLRETQGAPGAILKAGVIEDASGFPADSLFAEWGYVADFDAQAFEVYRGFQKEPHAEGRFAGMTPEGNGYFPVKLVAGWPLKSLPTDTEFNAAFADDGDE